ncbi:hypothetical protein F5883DRAFT_528981 [Diaporthe sp. PMI_573]|nr:hypothetical protein F5883DRAFT_528981 [Diaporthaceae sp. PMI_573]
MFFATFGKLSLEAFATEGTRRLLHENLPDGPFDDGKIYFAKNRGQGHLKDGNGKVSKPDWCLYQKTEDLEVEDHYGNLLPGDIKPAKKWKADWINSPRLHEKKKADLVLEQLTKCAPTRLEEVQGITRMGDLCT